MKLIALVAAVVAVAAPSKTVAISIVHSMTGCHVWATNRPLVADARA